MKRNLVVTIEFRKGHLNVCALEVLNTSLVKIYHKQGLISNYETFLNKSLKELGQKVGTTIKDVTFLVDDSIQVGSQIKVVKQEIDLPNNRVQISDIDTLLNQIKQKYSNQTYQVINTQPLEYQLKDLISKKYAQAPINKIGHKLSALVSVTLVKQEIATFMQKVGKKLRLNVLQILLRQQVISQTHLSTNALSQGANLLHFDKEQTYLTVNKNKSVVKLLTFYNFGLKKLLKAISLSFNCSTEKAWELLLIHGDLTANESKMIHIFEDGHNFGFQKSERLQKLIKAFVNRLATLSHKFLSQQHCLHFPLVISGDLSQIKGLKTYFNQVFDQVSLYKPLSYCELNQENHSTIGLINYNRTNYELIGKKIDTIIDTNPNTFSSLNWKTKRSWINFFNRKKGGKYEWN